MKFLAIFLLVVLTITATIVSSKSIQSPEKRLIKTSADHPGQWLDESEILELVRNGQGFMDVTDFDYSQISTESIDTRGIPTTLRFNATVRNVMSRLDTPREQQFLKTFSDFHTRYYSLDTGRSSQVWLYSEVDSSLRKYSGNATAFEVDHGFLQRSVVARLEGANPQLRNDVVIIGAHIDSINGKNVTFRAPGADDNGAGAAAVLETLRAIVDANVVFNRTVEFHFYAAEEIGLRGSQAIAQDYKEKNINVTGMFNLDVIAQYAEGINDLCLITDYGSVELVQFMRLLTNGYLIWGLRERTCGYGCSDHASWNANGYPATMGVEAVSQSYLHHTENDTYETVSFEQLDQFVRLSIAFVVEMAEPNRPL